MTGTVIIELSQSSYVGTRLSLAKSPRKGGVKKIMDFFNNYKIHAPLTSSYVQDMSPHIPTNIGNNLLPITESKPCGGGVC